MRYKVRLYFDKPIDERALQGILNSEFEMDEVSIEKIDDDNMGMRYALVSVSDDIPMTYLKTLGNNRYSVTSVVQENTMKKENETVIELPKDTEINGETYKAGTKIQVQEKKELKEDDLIEIEDDFYELLQDALFEKGSEYAANEVYTLIRKFVDEFHPDYNMMDFMNYLVRALDTLASKVARTS